MKRAAVLVAAAALVAYLPSLAGAFQFDDFNVAVGYPASYVLRPLLKASYAMNWALSEAPLGFHVFNMALHALNAVLLFLIGRRLFEKSEPAALLAALLFALHPAQTEAVTYVSGRSVSMMASFYLGSILLYLRGSRWSAVLFALALATRETAITLPGALLLCDAARGRFDLRRQVPHWLVFLVAALVLFSVPRYRELLLYGFSERGLVDNLLTQLGAISYLVARLVTLQGYNIDPGLPALHALDGTALFEAALLLALLGLGVACLRRRPWVGFGILWFLLQLAPTNSVVPRLDVANDRQLYLACWGLFLAICVQAGKAGLQRDLPLALGVASAAAFATASVARQLDYRNEVTLWEASVRESPGNARAHANLGYAYYTAGRKEEARREMRTALLLDPALDKARMNLRLLDWK